MSGARAAAAAALLAGLVACSACPPEWVARPPSGDDGFLYAAGSAGEVFVDADARDLAASRAARVLADRLGLTLEPRLAVIASPDGARVLVDGPAADGPLADLELVDEARCGETTHVLLRLPAPR